MVRNSDSIENAIGPQRPGGQYAYGIGGTDEPQRSQRTKSASCGRRGSGSTDTPVRQYVWGTYIDECIQINLLVAAGPQSVPAGAYYLLQDLLYRAVALTNSGGYIVEAYDTDAYGNTLVFTGPGADGIWFTDDDVQSDYGANEIIYCGYRFDPESQNYYVRNRTYSPVLGRWIQRDPIGYAGGINLYGYVRNHPVDKTDPSGEHIFAGEHGFAILKRGRPHMGSAMLWFWDSKWVHMTRGGKCYSVPMVPTEAPERDLIQNFVVKYVPMSQVQGNPATTMVTLGQWYGGAWATAQSLGAPAVGAGPGAAVGFGGSALGTIWGYQPVLNWEPVGRPHHRTVWVTVGKPFADWADAKLLANCPCGK